MIPLFFLPSSWSHKVFWDLILLCLMCGSHGHRTFPCLPEVISPRKDKRKALAFLLIFWFRVWLLSVVGCTHQTICGSCHYQRTIKDLSQVTNKTGHSLSEMLDVY